jgi:hypothetical protein
MPDTTIRVSEETLDLAKDIRKDDESLNDAVNRALREKTTYTWHPLPPVIGDAITRDGARCGGFRTEMNDEGTVVIYYDEERIGEIHEPAEGWEEGMSEITADIWDGWR